VARGIKFIKKEGIKNMRKILFIAAILGMVMLFAGTSLRAADEAVEAPMAIDAQEAYGEVVSVDVNAGTLIITEYDYEKDEDINNTYAIDKAATYENVKSLAEVKAGDWVALTLKPGAGSMNIAISVYVERYDIGEEMAPATPAAPVAEEMPQAE